MIRRPPRSTRVRSSAASDVYKRQPQEGQNDLKPILRRIREQFLTNILRPGKRHRESIDDGFAPSLLRSCQNGVATPGVETQLNLGHSLDLTYQPLKILGRITHRQPGDTDIQRLSSSSR